MTTVADINVGYVLSQYARYLADPASVEPAWRDYFERFGPPGDGRRPVPTDELTRHLAGALALVRAYRDFGYLGADLDPLGGAPRGDPSLDPAEHGLSPEIMAAIPAAILDVDLAGETLADLLPVLRATYSGTIAYQVEHIASHEERTWLRHWIEAGRHREPRSADERARILERLTEVEVFEQYLGRAYLGQKRFSIEGLDVLVPMLDLAIELPAEDGSLEDGSLEDGTPEDGTREIVLGMAHRGRLNVLAHTVGVPYATLLEEFEAGADIEAGRVPRGPTDDVKYHYGARGSRRTGSGREVAVTLLPNPSHVEAVDPVLEGNARAVQTDRRRPGAPHDASAALPILIHGDAAFAAQGVVAETFNLARLAGYSTGGTLHLIANNQLGFTTTAREGRSTDSAADLAKGFDVPVIHVNADDPEACLDAVRLAVAYRAEFGGDVVIDVVGYRRYGHNEGDEPAYTQPLMYERIAATPTVRERYLERLVADGVVAAAEAEEMGKNAFDRLDGIREEVRRRKAQRWSEVRERRPARREREPATTVDIGRLRQLNEALLAVPDGFTIHPKLVRPLGRRREPFAGRAASGRQGHEGSAGDRGRIDWGQAEALALASLVGDGVPVRLTGQDTERGTFSQRHLALFDARTGERYSPIEHLPRAKAAIEIHNSPLSEFACLGFEYGYAVAAPEALVVWEAQYGDFVNEAEVVVDQFIVAGLAKWGEASRLTLLLPHGFEGQGPEHSSARLERFLALCANGNLRVANPTTPAQYFHLLRRQGLHPVLRPLVVMTPKSLLRLPESTSTPEELAGGRFQPVMGPGRGVDHAAIRRLVLCSGKFFYDLWRSGSRDRHPEVALARIELLYPFPGGEIRALVRHLPKLEQLAWAQEEPRNMGALKFVLPELAGLSPSGVAVEAVARPERSSPAEGYGAAHLAEQRRIVREAFIGRRRQESGPRARGGAPASGRAPAAAVPWRTA